MRCRQCGVSCPKHWLPFCVDCRWMGGKGLAVGGFIVGAIWAVMRILAG
jgi:hypothetical protein